MRALTGNRVYPRFHAGLAGFTEGASMSWRVRTDVLMPAGVIVAGLVAGVVVAAPAFTGGLPGAERHCRAVTLAVSLKQEQSADQNSGDERIAANYCEPVRWAGPRTVN